MKPGRELDRLVAEVMGYYNFSQPLGPDTQYFADHSKWNDDAIKCVPAFSVDMNAAMDAWEWLEQNNPWKERDEDYLILFKWKGRSTVGRIFYAPSTDDYHLHTTPLVTGESYPHAISLAVVEASKVKK